MCRGKHSLMHCTDFKPKSATERKSFVETNKLCFNCLGNHSVTRCQSRHSCITCKVRHHTTLYDACNPTKSLDVSALSATRQVDDRKAILLVTTRVHVADRYNDSHTIRTPIDQGSEVSISEALLQRLRLPRSRYTVSIFGIGGSQSSTTRGNVTLSVTSATTGARLTAVAFVLPRLSLYQGSVLQNYLASHT